MKHRINLLASWVFLVLGLFFCVIAIASEAANLREEHRYRQFDRVDALIEKNAEGGGDFAALRSEASSKHEEISTLSTKLAEVKQTIDDFEETEQTIVVSTAENTVQLRRDGKVVFEAVCSTGKGTTLIDGGRKMVFSTPTGRFKIISKEENPVWVPPDWHYVEEARKKGLKVVRLEPGDTIDATTGGAPAPERAKSFWSRFRGEPESQSARKVLKVTGDTIVEVTNGVERELPAGQMIRVGDTVVIPPLGVKQRQFDKVLGSYRLNLGDGYALHGTQQTNQLGQSVTHGCVRLGDKDIEALYNTASVGDEVIIY